MMNVKRAFASGVLAIMGLLTTWDRADAQFAGPQYRRPIPILLPPIAPVNTNLNPRFGMPTPTMYGPSAQFFNVNTSYMGATAGGQLGQIGQLGQLGQLGGGGQLGQLGQLGALGGGGQLGQLGGGQFGQLGGGIGGGIGGKGGGFGGGIGGIGGIGGGIGGIGGGIGGQLGGGQFGSRYGI